jgi:putative membrane protein
MKTHSFLAITCAFALFAFAKLQAQSGVTLTDPEIASVAVTANQVDIGYAAVAIKKSKNADVLQFARTMSADHQSVINQAVALVNKLGVTPKDNDLSKKLNADAEATKKRLGSLSGKEFDKAYIENEVSYHKAVISVVETILVPQAQNGELKALLQKVVPVLKTHLEHSEQVQKAVAGNTKVSHGHH